MSTMRSHLRLIFSLLLFIFPDATLPSPGTAGAASSCGPFNCGSDNASEIIRYPFWLATKNESDHQAELLPASYCGYSELKLHCKDGWPILPLPEGDYVVTKINYTSRSFSLISTDFFLDWAGSCLRPLRNFTVGSNLSKAPADSTLTFFFNCSDELIDNVIYQEARIPCLSSGSQGSYVFMGDEIPKNFTRGACQEIVAVPAVSPGGPETMNISEIAEELDGILQRGFDLLWAPAAGGDDRCRSCEETQGKCWYGVGGFGERSFACFCGVELHESHCNDGGAAGDTSKST
ncbi:putative serine/threonine-protein kinase [Apostasia shenzhenica]|uniref:Putative serine/threonine-protein kinase n=1 Tax=Apostasia shenzhenica TaxID=1088818 RepID=A0A2I0B3V2_9ASPA|nr:putative serine/threonine-protein kinase [Apostasia shenzhenica]